MVRVTRLERNDQCGLIELPFFVNGNSRRDSIATLYLSVSETRQEVVVTDLWSFESQTRSIAPHGTQV